MRARSARHRVVRSDERIPADATEGARQRRGADAPGRRRLRGVARPALPSLRPVDRRPGLPDPRPGGGRRHRAGCLPGGVAQRGHLRPGAGLRARVDPADRAFPPAERVAPPEPAARARDRSRRARAREPPRATLQSAVDDLPPPQRQAIRLAFLHDLTHEQVAAELGLPLGTAKTRIRAGLQKLRGRLGPRWAALAAFGLLVALGVRYRSEHATLERYDRALSMVTASDSVNLRLGPLSGTPEEAHARYRGRPGVGIAVVTFSKLPPAPAGK